MNKVINRRSFLKFAGLYGISNLICPAFTGNNPKADIPTKANRIDVHHHILPPVYKAALEKKGIKAAGGVPFPSWNAQRSLQVMDENGIAAAVTSISSPGIYLGDGRFTADLARRCNEFSADLISDHPTRFGGFAVLPLPDVEAALKALEYALDVLKLDGVVLLTNVDGKYLGTSKFEDLYTELNRRRAIVYVHPTTPAKGSYPKMDMPPSIIEFVFDTTRAISNLIINKTFKRYPDIRYIVAHAGGTAPYIAWRISLLNYRYFVDAIGDLKSLYYDTALSASPFALRSLQELVDDSHIVFGSDYPFAPQTLTSASISELSTFDGFDEKQLQAIFKDNAIALFPRFAGI